MDSDSEKKKSRVQLFNYGNKQDFLTLACMIVRSQIAEG